MNRHAVFAIVLLVGLFAINWFNKTDQSTMPDIAFNDIDHQPHSLAQYKGKPILITFWATDCPGCTAEMPDLITLYNTFSGQGLTMIEVALAHDTPKQIKAMRKERNLPFIITWDKDSAIAQAFGNVRVTPTHFLIDPDGKIVMRKIGALNFVRLHAMLNKMGLSDS
ncbi:MAG: TlpA disulfide reductase family protein [Gammaproteobacteria bacterium]|nr:TlpA disulfide reductase family protein [Gammaproteobacteria bacterium]